MKSLLISLCLLLLTESNELLAQPIRIGDKLPDTELGNVYNYPDTSLRLSRFRGKLVILDFWNHTCRACVAGFPKLENLQKKFGDKIQIVLVNPESKDSTRNFFAKHKSVYLPALPMITGDRIIKSYFPNQSNPYHVWIDGQGIVRHLTETYNAAEKNIIKFLEGENNIIHNRKENKERFSPLLKTGTENWENDFYYSSYLARCLGRTGGGTSTGASLSGGNSVIFSKNCSSILQLYEMAYNPGEKITREIRLLVKDSFRYIRPKDPTMWNKWNEEYSFSYNLILPASQKPNGFKIMQEDLDRYFHLKVRIVKKKIPAMALVMLNKEDKLKTKGGQYVWELSRSDDVLDPAATVLQVRNIPFQSFSNWLGGRLSSISLGFTDQTGYSGNIDMDITRKLQRPFDLEGMKKLLHSYNMDLVNTESEVEILVIEEQ
jgi:thiol-disulfide isomerase/thioredoxin